ncbi:hypothetical protein [Sphingomicrobium arenosum]|uniref:hypothetical protein n=1 Tax=Sphingomicrobium arenosum TaxID=2233861 RepID=UPI0022407F0B|nr:hypothetical protein [Sphingomicrobium arenosum]
MHFADLLATILVILLPMALVTYFLNRWFNQRERKIEIEAHMAAEKAAQYATANQAIEQRVRVLEQIVVDSGAQTASQIEALRDIQQLGHLEPKKEAVR